MRRRDFLRYQVHGALWLAAGTVGLFLPRPALASGAPDLAVVKGKQAAAARAAVELLGGMKRFVKKGNKVVIKPNMSFTSTPDQASNTHPAVVAALASMCWEAGAASVLILDNPLAPEEECLKQSGILAAANAVRPGMVHMVSSSRLFKDVDIKGAKEMPSMAVVRQVLDADVLIAAPVAKSHSSAGVSLSMKGMMGLIHDRWAMHGRYGLDASIVDMASLLKPQLAVIDASRVLTTGGPRGPGKVIKPNTIIASADMVAADAMTVASFEWYGKRFKPQQVPHIKLAAERGLGSMDLANLKVKRISL